MYSLAISKFDIPGDAGFPLNAVYAKPTTPSDSGNYQTYRNKINNFYFSLNIATFDDEVV